MNSAIYGLSHESHTSNGLMKISTNNFFDAKFWLKDMKDPSLKPVYYLNPDMMKYWKDVIDLYNAYSPLINGNFPEAIFASVCLDFYKKLPAYIKFYKQ